MGNNIVAARHCVAREIQTDVIDVAKQHGRSLSPYNVEGTIRKMIGNHRRLKGKADE